ncbi:MAG: helix-turn-helix domain-containing protein [Acidobacteriaceae bacterium]
MKRELDNLVVQMYASGITYEEAIREFRRRYIQEVLARNKGNQCKAARELGVHRNTLSRIMADLELDPAQIKLGLKRPARGEHAVFPPVQMVRSK